MPYEPLNTEEDYHAPPSRHQPFSFFGMSRRSLVSISTVFIIFALYYLLSDGVGNGVGSQSWKESYPEYEHGPMPLPEWLDTLDKVKSQGLIPDIPPANLNMRNGLGEYPASYTVDSEKVCSYRRNGCLAPTDITTLPKSRWAINFDDGPLPPSETLYNFLDAQSKKATHFWIGYNVKKHWPLAKRAAKRGDHLAIHTWSHAHLTTYDDEGVIGELGWCMKIIQDISGKRPLYFRPPYGDMDNRVRALAKHVLGLTPIMWSADSVDWTLNQTYASGDFVDPPYGDWTTTTSINQVKSEIQRHAKADRGVIILEHELSEESIETFIKTFPDLQENGYTTGAIPELQEGMPW